jgi:outer membrane protein assembly factor BamB
VLVVTTTFGHTIALDPRSGTRLWEFVPARSAQITTATPVLDPSRRYLYAASPDGMIHKLSVVSGRQLWAARITFDPRREKIEGGLNISGKYVIAATGGYNGDAPTYEGHVALIDRASGRVAHVWNAECSDRHHLLDPPRSCTADTSFGGSAIWGRSGAIVQLATHRLIVATGNGPFNGTTNWGDSVIVLSADAERILHTWTPQNQAQLNSRDTDVGSTEPALLPGGLAVQGGKSGALALLKLTRQGVGKTGGALQTLASPGGSEVLSTPAVWHDHVFVADDSGTAAYVLRRGRLHVAWQDGSGGSSPVVAGGLLYVYDQGAGTLRILRPSSGATVATLPAAPGHWSSPIVVGGRVILAVGGSPSDNATSGTVFVYHLAGR